MKRRGNISYMLFLAVTAAVGGLLFGYDTAVIFGTVELVTARFGLDSLQQGWYVGCALAGSIAGVLCAGVLSDRLGRRRTMLVSAVLFTVSAAGCALCADFTQLVVYRIVGGLIFSLCLMAFILSGRLLFLLLPTYGQEKGRI